MHIFKKLAISSLSLLLMASVGTSASANAKRAHHYHYHNHVTKVIHKHKNHKQKYLPFKKLLHDMTLDEAQDHEEGGVYVDYHKIILRTLWHNLNKYSVNQLHQLLQNPDVKGFQNSYVLDFDDFDPMNYTKGPQLINNLRSTYLDKELAENHSTPLSQQDTPFDTEVRADLINDINNTREEYGLKPLTVTNVMQSVANYRTPKVQYAYEHLSDYLNYPHNTSNPYDGWVHGDVTHDDGYDYLEHHGYSYDWSANASNIHIGNNVAVNGDGAPLKYDNTTPAGVAANIDDGFINHDNCEGNNNGHRKIELNPDFKYLGVGVTYDPQAHLGSVNEQYACNERLKFY